VSLKTRTVWAVNQTPLLPYAERKVWHHPARYQLANAKLFIIGPAQTLAYIERDVASIAVATEIRQFNAVYKAYSESFRKNKE